MSFSWPLALAALALVPIAVWAYNALDARRREDASRFANAALLPGLVSAEPAGAALCRRYWCSWRSCSSSSGSRART